MTRKKRHPAAASRILAGGLSTAAVFAITGGLAAGQPAAELPPPTPRRHAQHGSGSRDLRVVVTDDRIDANDAVVAARRALRRGQDEAYVEVEPLPPEVRYVSVSQPSVAAQTSAVGTSAPPPPPPPNAGHTASSGS